jgi:selenide,water dikinase
VNADDAGPAAKPVVLLGIGHTNAHVIKEWVSNPIPGHRLVCVSKFPNSTYSGMLPGTLGRQFEEHEMRVPLRELADRAGAELVLADASGIDLRRGELTFSDRVAIPFAAMSIGVGSMPIGWEAFSDRPNFVAIKPMQTFLSRLHACLDTAVAKSSDRVRVAMVGGGVAGVEIALCLQQLWQRRGEKIALQIDIFTSSDRVAGGMRPRSVRRIERLLNRRGIVVHAGHRVTKVEQQQIETDGGSHFQADCVIWATGAAPPPVIEQLGLRTDERGFIATKPTLQSFSDDRIFAVGDSGTVVDHPAPKAGVYAVRQCPILWHNLRAFLRREPLEAFRPQSDFLKLLNTGDGKALMEYGRLTVHARWCWHLKTWIDKHFIQEFQPSS